MLYNLIIFVSLMIILNYYFLMHRDNIDSNILNIWMGRREINLIKSYLDNNFTFLEYGSGGSTIHFSSYVKKYYSIESNQDYCKILKKKIINLKNVNYNCIPVELPSNWTIWTEGTCKVYEDYVKHVSQLGEKHFNLILIDGRARVCCAIYILRYIDTNSRVFIHDYWRRKYYHEIEDMKSKRISLSNSYPDHSQLSREVFASPRVRHYRSMPSLNSL